MNSNKLTREEISEFNHSKSEKILKKIFDSTFRPLHYFSYYITRDNKEAEDIASKCLTKLWQSKWQFNTETEIKMFLFKAAKNECLNILKQRKRQQSKHKDMKHTQLTEENIIEKALEETQIIEMIAAIIEDIPGKMGAILKLYFFEELKNQEIANRLNTSENSVAQLKIKGLKKIRKFLRRD